jgi:hypothetical protein
MTGLPTIDQRDTSGFKSLDASRNKVFKAMLFHMDLSTIFNQLIHHRYPLKIHSFQPQNGMISMVFHVVKHHGS